MDAPRPDSGELRREWIDRSGSLNVGATAQDVAPESLTRRSFFIMNLSADLLFVQFSNTLKAVQGLPCFRLEANGGSISLEKEKGFVPTSRITIIGPNATAAFSAREY